MLSLRCGAVTKLSLIVLLAIVACPGLAFATNYSCSGSGTRNWHTAGDWAPNGIPGAGDTVVITNGCTMQCEANNTCTAGKSGNPGSVDMTIQVGGVIVVDNGANLDMRGDVTMSGELDIFGGTFTLDPSSAGGSMYYIDGGSDSGADTLKICSESSCSSNLGNLGKLTCNKGSGSCQVRHISFIGNGMNVLGSHGQISNFGTSSLPSISLVDGALPPSGGFVLKNNFSVHNNGVVRVDYESPTLNLTFDQVSFDTVVDVNGSSNGYSFLDLFSRVTPTSGDRTFRVTCANPGSHEATLFLQVVNADVGDSAHPGLVSYNCILANDANGVTFQNILNVVDRNVTSGSSLFTSYNSNSQFQDWVIYDHTPNQHHIVGYAASGGGTSNTYTRMTFDGDGFSGYDDGDDYQDLGNYTASYGLHINSSGTLFTLGNTTAQSASFDHETVYNSYGGSLCEGAQCTSLALRNVSNSLFVLPSQLLGAEYPGDDGIHTGAGFTYLTRLTSPSSATDYNFFWQMPGSGDPGANPARNIHIQLNLNGTPSWVAATDLSSNIVSNQAATITGTSVTCTNCFVNAKPKDYIVDRTQSPNQYGVIQSISDVSHATLYASIQGWSNGDVVDVRPAYFATNGLYGVDWGAHDQHIEPWFQDVTRTVCSWWKQQVGSPANCFWPSGNNYTASSGTNSTTIVDTGVNFNTLGVKDGVDVVMVYNTGWGPVGSATVVSHTATSLTVNSIPGAAQGDFFTFITAPQSLGQAVVQLYGFDVNGNQVTPPAWVNNNMVQSVETYLQRGYAPTNLAFFGAGSDGQTVGAIQVLPANAAISVTTN